MKLNIRLLYLYLFSFVGLVVTVIGTIRLVDLGIKVYVFQNADQYPYVRPIYPVDEKSLPSKADEEALQKQQEEDNKRERRRTTAEALAMIIVGIPLYTYHWKLAQKESQKDKR